ncbi:MAG: hypothetical protein KF688_08790 [Pirellulales bacterium]|nr:hypothetical protein [Pirellulales bacterium]
MKPSPKKLAVAAAVCFAVVLAGSLIFRGEYPTEQSSTRSFTLPVDFTTVRKVLVRKDGAKQIIAMGGDSEFVEQKWSAIGGDVESLKLLEPDWRLELHGTLKVKTLDDYVGEQVVALAQDVTITVDELDSKVELKEGSERLAGYAMRTQFRRSEEGKTEIELSLKQKIVTDAPWFAHGIADRRVKAAVEKTLANQERAISEFIEANKNDVPLLPLR